MDVNVVTNANMIAALNYLGKNDIHPDISGPDLYVLLVSKIEACVRERNNRTGYFK